MRIKPQTFAFSESYLANRRRFMYLLAAPLVILIVFEMLTMAGFVVSPGLVIVTILIFIIIILDARYTHGQWRQMRLHIGPDGLVRERGRVQQTVTWDSITKVRFRIDRRGKTRVIDVFVTNGSPLLLFGFERMDEVVRLMEEGIPSTAQAEIKRQWLDSNWNNPLVILALVLMGPLMFEAIRRIGGKAVSNDIDSLISLIPLAMGVYILFRGLLSRTDPNRRKWDIVIGILIAIIALVGLYITWSI